MAQQKTNPTFGIYGVRISIEVVRKTDRYNTDTLAKVTTDEEFPLPFEVTLDEVIAASNARIYDAQRKAETVLDARGEFERKVHLALGPGEVIEQ